jgi:DNA-binding NarL/FixJ family response regulator
VLDLIVGREAELAAVERFIERVPGGPAALLIEGEAGIGKTTVWAEAVRAAERRGFRVLEARPAESEAQLSYAALADLVDEVFDDTCATLPPVQERALAAALLRTDAADGASARTTGTAVVSVLAALAEREPVVVALDDLQWLDPASAEALAFAARRLPPRVGLLAARRAEPGTEPPLALARAFGDERLERVAPGPLSLAALHHLIVGRLGAPLSRPQLVRVAAASGGNPFFALELARALQVDGGADDAEPLPLPRSLEDVIAARVGALSLTARQVALAAAALSRPTTPLLVEALPETDARAGLLEAEEAGVLVGERDRIRFSHPLLASAVYATASRERRRRLHERLAELVEDPEERARHLAQAATEPDEQVADDLERAAEHAARRGAQDAARELYAASRRLTPGGLDEELTRRTVCEASARLAVADVAGARALAEEAAASPFPGLRAEALHLLGEIAWIGGSTEFDDFLVRALAAAEGDASIAARVYPKLVNYNTGHRSARAVEHAEAALKVLSADDYPGALASILMDKLWAGILLGFGPQPQLFRRWRKLDEQAGPDAPQSMVALIYFWAVDDFEAARAQHEREDRWFRERGEDVRRAERLSHRGMTELRAGQWELAERYVEESCAGMAEVGRVGPWAMPFRLRALVDAHRGRVDRARETLLPLVEDAERSPRPFWNMLLQSGLAFVEFAAGDHRASDEAVARMREWTARLGIRDPAPDRSEPFHVESLLALGEVEHARDALERLEERARTFPRPWIAVTLPPARALIRAGDGDVDGALAEFDGLDVEGAARLPFELAWALLVRGRLQRRAKQRRAAADSLREAAELFDRVGAPAFAEHARTELGRVGLRRAPAQGAPSELTPTELRVAELAGSGLTNREVASKAFMSPKTVQANLARVYRKLGITSRAELGARMADERRRLDAQT